MVGTYLIYGLIDPRSGELRYVGRTVKTVFARRGQHLYDVRQGDSTYKANWLRQLLAAGLKPDVEVLEVHQTTEALVEAEKHFIAYFRSIGCRLTNLTDGGEGASGWTPSPEWRRRKSDSVSEFFRSAPARRRASESVREAMARAEVRANTSAAQRRRFADEQVRDDASLLHGGRRFVDQNGVVYLNRRTAAKRLGLSPGNIYHVLSGRRSHTKGFVFTYCEEANAA